MSTFDALFPIPTGGRNADDMGMPGSSPQAPDRSDEARAEPTLLAEDIKQLARDWRQTENPDDAAAIQRLLEPLIDKLAALATPVEARGGPDGDVLAALDLNRLRDGSRRSLDPANQALFDEVWDLRHPAECSPTLTECPRCKNDFRKCDGFGPSVDAAIAAALPEPSRPACPECAKQTEKWQRVVREHHASGMKGHTQ